tara:strand:+ start:146 stop:487 length:342 start_codon:yes stop_codon:yes gene_type:complete
MILFSVIDSTIFLFIEEDLDEYFIKHFNLDKISRPILLSGISAAIAILFASSLEHKLSQKFNIIKNPIIDSIGIIIGAILVIIIYKLYKGIYDLEYSVSTRFDRDKNKDNKID